MTASDIQVGDILKHEDSGYELITKIEVIYDPLLDIERIKIYSDSLDEHFNRAYDELDLNIFSVCERNHTLGGWYKIICADCDLGI